MRWRLVWESVELRLCLTGPDGMLTRRSRALP